MTVGERMSKGHGRILDLLVNIDMVDRRGEIDQRFDQVFEGGVP